MTNSQTSSEHSAQLADVPVVDRICKTHGPYKARCFEMPFGMAPRISNCPVCVAEETSKREAEEQAAREERRRMSIRALCAASRIPPRYRDSTIAGLEGESAGLVRVRKACEAFVTNWGEKASAGPSVIMCGRPGTGKTHAACAIGLDLIERYGASVLFHTALSAIRSIKDTYRKESEVSESEAIADLIKPSLLIMDEIGVQVGSEHESMLVFEVINERYQQCKSTILISNLDREELGKYLGDRIIDRFRECGGVLAFDWASYRGSKK